MFQPKFTLSSKLLTNITSIERFYGQLESLRISPNLQLNLERHNLIRSSYISNSIEGNPLSLPEVTNLLLGDRLPVNRDEKEVQNYFNILKNLSTYLEQPFSLSVVSCFACPEPLGPELVAEGSVESEGGEDLKELMITMALG